MIVRECIARDVIRPVIISHVKYCRSKIRRHLRIVSHGEPRFKPIFIVYDFNIKNRCRFTRKQAYIFCCIRYSRQTLHGIVGNKQKRCQSHENGDICEDHPILRSPAAKTNESYVHMHPH